jgi:hypothetical protein
MKRAAIGFLALVIINWPLFVHAQYTNEDRQDPGRYNDVDDGQALKLVSYILTPFGMALEWGLTRPLHSLATNGPVAPLLSGDTEPSYFGQNNNADQLPPGTFGRYTISGPFTMNPSSPAQVTSAPAAAVAPLETPVYSTRPQGVQTAQPGAVPATGQTVIH